jgi:hypothetical protein
MFKYYVSLGENCEVAFQMRRVLGRDESSFFSWNITSFEALTSLLTHRFQGIMQLENLSTKSQGGSLIHDAAHDYWFHSDFPHYADVDFSDHPETLANHITKANYLTSKFYEIARSGQNIAFFYKTAAENVKIKSIILRENLLAVTQGMSPFTLVVIQTQDRSEQDWALNGIANRYVARFAPRGDAHDGHVSSWDKIFAEFRHIDGLRLAGY